MSRIQRSPILVTGAAGQVGSVSTTLVHLLLANAWPVRAFVRTDDHRAEALRQAGAEVFVGDLLNVADVTTALKGCHRVYFSMTVGLYYADATILMAAAAEAQGDVEIIVNMSDSEQTNLTFDRMTAPAKQRTAWLGNGVGQWSPQQRAHWVGERALDWSGLPVTHIHAGIFVENPILSWYPVPDLVQTGELRLPFGDAKLAPIAAYDVAELSAKILQEPLSHIRKVYTLIGPELKNMTRYAEDYAAALHRPVVYVPQELERWNEKYIDPALADKPHNAEHLKTLTRLVASGRYYDVATDDLSELLGRPATTLRWALEHYPHVHELVREARKAS
jgi:NAD(P)H dehydrogenase (quinone)